MSVGPPRWTWRSRSSTACWRSDARITSAPLDPGRGRGQCARDPDPCNTVHRDPPSAWKPYFRMDHSKGGGLNHQDRGMAAMEHDPTLGPQLGEAECAH